MAPKRKSSSEVAQLKSAIRTLQQDADAQLSVTSQVRALRSAFVTLSDAVIEEADTIRAAVSAQALETDRELSKYRSALHNSASKSEIQEVHDTLSEITGTISKISSNLNFLREQYGTLNTQYEDIVENREGLASLSDVRQLIKKSEVRNLKQIVSEATEDITSRLSSIAEDKAKETVHNNVGDLRHWVEQVERESGETSALLARDISMMADNVGSLKKEMVTHDDVSDIYTKMKKLNENFNQQLDLVIAKVSHVSDTNHSISSRLDSLDNEMYHFKEEVWRKIGSVEEGLVERISLISQAISKLTSVIEGNSGFEEGYLS
ncbi:hypothetical protein P9112_008082 [Eukaryota sp. TZLM1-RC]